MKKNLFMVAAVALMALVSCSKEDLTNKGVQGEASDIVFSAELEQPAGEPAAQPSEIQSKTSLGAMSGNNRPVSWVKGDQIKINGVTFTAASAGSRTDFTPTGSFNTAATYYAVYPATATSKADHSAITIPASQDGSFAKAAISVAMSSTQSLSFKNVASIIKFRVPAAASKVTITSSDNLAGTLSVTFENGLPKIETVTSASKTITVTASFQANTDYYVAVLPGAHKKFTVRIDGLLIKTPSPVVNFSRANLTNLGTFKKPSQSSWYIKGNLNGWGTTDRMYEYDTYYYLNNVDLMKNGGGFKFWRAKQGDEKDDTWIGGAATINTNEWAYKWNDANDVNISGGTAGTLYDVYFSKDNNRFYVTLAGSEVPINNYILLDTSSSSWTKHLLYAWSEDGNTCGNWSGWEMPKVTINNSAYKYVSIPTYVNKINFIFNNGSGSQTADITNVSMTSTVTYKLSGTTATKVTTPNF